MTDELGENKNSSKAASSLGKRRPTHLSQNAIKMQKMQIVARVLRIWMDTPTIICSGLVVT